MVKQKKRINFNFYSGFLIVAVLFSVNAFAISRLSPSWTKQAYYNMSPNDSFLADLERRASTQTTIEAQIFDSKQLFEAQGQYRTMVKNYEFKKNYGLVSMEEEQAHADRLSSWGKGVFNNARLKKLRSTLKDAETAAGKDPNGRYFSKPIAVAGFVAAVCSGTPIEFSLGETTNVTSVTNVSDQTGKFMVRNPVLDAGIDVAGKAPTEPTDLSAIKERYRFSLSRNLPFIDVTSGVSYGTTTGGVTTSIAKNIVDNLTCVLDSTRAARGGAIAPRNQETLRFLYNLSF